MSEAFTPGPWRREGMELVGSNGKTVVASTSLAFGSPVSWPDAEANGNLLEASPEMYESLQDLIIAMEDAGLGHIDDVEKARTVSRKALGEQT